AGERSPARPGDLRRHPVQLLTRTGGEGHRGARPRKREGDGASDPAPRARDDGDLAGERPGGQMTSPLRDLISSMNSARVSALSRKAPSIADVTALEFCFSTPRISMQRWMASTTTATPRGWRTSFKVLAICVVKRSWTCSRRLNISTSRGSFDSPTILREGMYAMWHLPKNGMR